MGSGCSQHCRAAPAAPSCGGTGERRRRQLGFLCGERVGGAAGAVPGQQWLCCCSSVLVTSSPEAEGVAAGAPTHVPAGTRCSMSCLHCGCIPVKSGSQFCCPHHGHPPLPVTLLWQCPGTAPRPQPCWLPSLASHPPDSMGSVPALQGGSAVSWSPHGLSSLPALEAAAHIWQTSAEGPAAGAAGCAAARGAPCPAWPCPARPGRGIRGAGTAVIPGSARRQLILTPVLPTARASTSCQHHGSAELLGRCGAGVPCSFPIPAVPSLLPLPSQQPRSEGLAAAQPGPHHQCCSPFRRPGCGVVPAPGSFHHLLPSAAQPICCFAI